MSLITIKRANIVTELFVLRSKLESEGINCYLKNELTTQIMNYLPFEVELQISDSDLERATEIINKMSDA